MAPLHAQIYMFPDKVVQPVQGPQTMPAYMRQENVSSFASIVNACHNMVDSPSSRGFSF